MIDISGLDHARVLKALYERAQVQGLGVLQAVQGLLPLKEAEKLMAGSGYFDYLKGRVMKIEISGTQIDERLYDRDNGPGAAASAIEGLRK